MALILFQPKEEVARDIDNRCHPSPGAALPSESANCLPTTIDEEGMLENEPLTRRSTDPVKRLATAVIMQAAIDFTTAQNPRIWNDAQQFLFVENPDFHRNAEAAGLNPHWLREQLQRVAEQVPVPATHRCKNCGPLPASAFHINWRQPSGLTSQCRDCLNGKAILRRRLAGIGPRRSGRLSRFAPGSDSPGTPDYAA